MSDIQGEKESREAVERGKGKVKDK